MPDSPSAVDRVVKFLPAIVPTLLGVTATVLVGYIGVVVLAITWVTLIALGALAFAMKWHRDFITAVSERDNFQRQLQELQATATSGVADKDKLAALQGEVQGWKAKALEGQSQRSGLEAELEELRGKLALASVGTTEGRGVLLATQLTCSAEESLPGGGVELNEEDLEPETYDFASKRLTRGIVIDILAESDTRFMFSLYDEENMRRFAEHRRNTQATAGKENVTLYRERITIPHGGEWFFLVQPQFEGEELEVRLRVILVWEP